MKQVLFGGLTLALMASAAVAAEGRTLRSVLANALAPALASQSNDIPMPSLKPTPDPAFAQTSDTVIVPSPSVGLPTPVVSQPVQLFTDVRYRAPRNIAPCAVPTIIQVVDPCDPCCRRCVNIEVCAPPCEPCKVKVTRDGDRVRYDYGKYAITAWTVGDHVVVRYHD